MKIAIRQVKGGSGVDVWAGSLCRGIQKVGHTCELDLCSGVYQFIPQLAGFRKTTSGSDIIQSNSWNAFAFREDVPLVVTEHHVVHDPAYSPYKTLPQKIFHRWIYQCEQRSLDVADAVICDCEYTRKKLKEAFGYSDARVVYVGIDEELFKPAPPELQYSQIPEAKTILFFAGNLSTRKGADLLPSIMKELGDDYLLLVASGQKQGSVPGCRSIVNLGRLSLADLVATYNRCDIFLTPSRLEGFGLSVAEAMACEKPVVATNGSSLPELVVDGKGGFLCGMDNVLDFAEKIALLAGDADMRYKMGTFNRQRIKETFTVEKMTTEYLNIYRSILLSH